MNGINWYLILLLIPESMIFTENYVKSEYTFEVKFVLRVFFSHGNNAIVYMPKSVQDKGITDL